MSARNGDRARFHKDRKRKLLKRQRIQALQSSLGIAAPAASALNNVTEPRDAQQGRR
jgi:hypothetical protein